MGRRAASRQRSVERLIPAPPERILALLVDVHQHSRLDGSGMLRGSPQGPERLSLGSTFTMGMRQGALRYRSVSRVVEHEEGRLIAWRSTGEVGGRRVVGGQVWRYELEPQPPSGAATADGARTLVRETYDWSGALLPRLTIELPGYPARMERAMTASLKRLEHLLA